MLVVHRFTCGAMGLASPADISRGNSRSWTVLLNRIWSALRGNRTGPEPITAVCVPHGTRLLVLDIPQNLRREMNVQCKEEVTFRQLSVSTFEYRDAIRFGNGRQVLLQKLREGQRVRILDASDEADNYAWELSNRFGGWQRDLEVETAARVGARMADIPGTVVV